MGRLLVVTAIATVVLLVIGGAIGYVIGITTPRTLGGIDIQAACSQLFAGSKATVAHQNIYGWRCVNQATGTSRGIDLNHQCVVQYGNGATAFYTDFNNPLSWKCKR